MFYILYFKLGYMELFLYAVERNSLTLVNSL